MRNAAVMLVVNKDGYILGVSRRNDPERFGIPGGKVDLNESFEEAAIRETKEETSLIVYATDLIYEREEPAGTPEGFPFYTKCFYAISWEGQPQNSEEGIVEWLTVMELTENRAAFAEYNKNMLSAFKEKYPKIKLK
jgi:ADP-ribose pyrophosphatase YjhB (NUDIX family)